MENSVFNILITKCRYNISDNHQSDVTINSFDISFLFFFPTLHVQHYVGIYLFIYFFNNKKRIQDSHLSYLQLKSVMCLVISKFLLIWLLYFSALKCFMECHKLSECLLLRGYVWIAVSDSCSYFASNTETKNLWLLSVGCYLCKKIDKIK